MPDREKVISEIVERIESSLAVDSEYVNVPLDLLQYALALLKEQQEEIENLKQTAQSMIEGVCLLKEQEAVEPEVEVLNEIDRIYRCPKCHKHFFYEKQKYCDQCGQAVKWE